MALSHCVKDVKRFVKRLRFPIHCIHCEGIDEGIENPRHHPSYEITCKCNLNCMFCYSKIAEIKGTAPEPGYYGDLNPKVVTISQFGEPFYYGSEIVAIVIDKLREIFGDVRIDVQTNGTLVNFDVIDGRVDVFMVSLNASNKENYFRITGSKFFDRVLQVIKRASKSDCKTIIRTVYIPGLNDRDLIGIAEIAKEVDELFLQPLSIYEEHKGLLKSIDIDRVESIGNFLKVAYELSEIADVRIPGCILLNVRSLMKTYDFEEIMLMRRNPFGKSPVIRREWRFVIPL